MDCCKCKGIESVFNEKEAKNKLKAYRENGPARTTRMLIEAIEAQEGFSRTQEQEQGGNTDGVTLLDIGGGVGAIQHSLLRAGVERATGVDASSAYLKAAREEAARQGHADSVTYLHADFVDVAPQIATADIVTLDRVICCYHDMKTLVELSAARAGLLYGLVYPRDTWWIRAAISTGNLFLRVRRNPFRAYVHRTQDVDALVRSNGLRQRFCKTSGMWQVVVYAR